ncbi:MAG: MBL fold metallo-hydrolase [Elusimicrobia bacterium]|nr:MBL fold metallo-hydrolase [Elusimicrobiota bacterium]
MKITCWGARGSIPVSGPEYLKYGGDTTCLEVRSSAGDVVVVDCGSGVRRLGNRLVEEHVRDITVLFTHSHWDHILGFPFFKPIYNAENRITFHGCPFAQRSIRTVIEKIMEPPQFPINLGAIRAELAFNDPCLEGVSVGSLKIKSIVLSHPNQGLGYRFEEDGKAFVFLTDNELDFQHPGGCRFRDYADFSAGADFLIHDAEFTEADYKRTRAWGHSTFGQALELALAAKARRFGLFHHNQDRPDSEVDAMVEDCRRIAAARHSPVECFALTQETVVEL